MISISEALDHIRAQVRPLPSESVPLHQALDHVLAEDVASDVDSPPHDKSIVDGYAIRCADIAQAGTTLNVIEEVVAGAVPQQAVVAGTATRIMTGAPVPKGADAVVMVEQTEIVGRDRVRISAERITPGRNIMRRAASMRRGETVLQAGHRLRPMEIGLLAEVGRSQVLVVRRPRVAVLPTGDELVSPAEIPAAGQIRNSNGAMLLAAVRRAGGESIELGIGRDNRDSLRRLIGEGLQHDMLLISGGVSAGVLDLVPGVLAELGVRQIFHKVNIKPGKPLWFGVLETGGSAKLVFGLPGNPVSSLVCFELFVRPALRALAGYGFQPRESLIAQLGDDFQQRGERVAYHPARLSGEAGSMVVEPLLWQGSGDLRTLVKANSLIRFDAGERLFKADEPVEGVLLD
jgi:molybdopterin molybdotransferase